MTTPSKHITICICTYKRPHLLSRLLEKLEDQSTEGLFTYSIVVADNDSAESAREAVEKHKKRSALGLDYFVEPIQNIALARNRAVDNAKGDFIAFIDDDEFPERTWLLNLFNSCTRYNVDGVLGEVKPRFDESPPDWLLKGRFCERPTPKTGTLLHWNDGRTGNALLKIEIFKDNKNRFNPEFGRTGGEDGDFFKRMVESGRTFVWVKEAIVYEVIVPERWKESFYLKKSLRIGGLNGEFAKTKPFSAIKYLVKAVSAIAIFTSMLPFSFLVGRHYSIKCLTKVLYNFGWIIGLCGWVIIRYRTE